jgi:hypothetical protein
MMQVELRAVAVQQNRAERRRLVKGKMTVYFEGIKKKKKKIRYPRRRRAWKSVVNVGRLIASAKSNYQASNEPLHEREEVKVEKGRIKSNYVQSPFIKTALNGDVSSRSR